MILITVCPWSIILSQQRVIFRVPISNILHCQQRDVLSTKSKFSLNDFVYFLLGDRSGFGTGGCPGGLCPGGCPENYVLEQNNSKILITFLKFFLNIGFLHIEAKLILETMSSVSALRKTLFD